jgi:predicted Zn-dependent peptidase
VNHTVSEITLKNGLKGLVLHIADAPVVSIEISFRAGEFLLERNKWETAHIMEHLMLGANKQFASSRLFQSELEKNGAYSNASTSAYDIGYEVECAAFESERVLRLLVDALETPVFLESEFKAEYGNVAEELESRSNNHFRTLNLALRESLGLYGVSDTERVRLMPNVTIDDIKNHYNSTHSVANARFIIAGDITDAHIDILSKLQLNSSCERIELPDEAPKHLSKTVRINRKDVPNMYFYIDTYAPKLLSEKERDALSVLTTILTETLHSQLLGTAREKGLVYAMGSGQQHLKTRSSFWIGAQVSKKNASALFDLMQSVMHSIKKDGITDTDLEAAKQYMEGKHARSAQTVTGLLGKYTEDYFKNGYIAHQQEYIDRIRSVSARDISSALELITEGEWALGVLGDVSDTYAQTLHDKTDAMLHL